MSKTYILWIYKLKGTIITIKESFYNFFYEQIMRGDIYCKVIREIPKQILFFYFAGILTMSCGRSDQSAETRALEPLPPETDAFFTEITVPAGIDFVHSVGDDHLSNLVESVGGGAVFLDYDQDGWIDLYLSNGSYNQDLSRGEPKDEELKNCMYRNLQDGHYSNVTKNTKTGDQGYGMGMTVGDYDNDGYPDIYISNYGPNVLYHNNGDGTFKDVTKKAGVGGDACSVGAVWFDYDNDGLLDLYVGNYIKFDPKYNYYYAPDGFPGPMAYDAEPDVLYHNLGDGKFEDVTHEMGVFNPEGRAMGVGAADYDNDGWVDLYVANDHMINYLWHNEAGKKFKDTGVSTGVAFNQVGEGTISMSVDFADYDGDGLLDLFVSDDAYCSLYKNLGNGLFSEMSDPAGIAQPSGQFVGWASSFIDYDNDGDLDIFKVNGELKHLYGQEDQLFENQGNGKFVDVSVDRGPYFQKEFVGRGACFGDYDNDGDIDAYIVNLDSTGVLLRNDKGNLNNWIQLKLVGTKSNRDGIGARITVTAGDIRQVAQKKSTNGYLSQNDPRMHFGLGKHEKVDKIEIIWPSGTTQTLENIKSGQVITVTEP